MEEKLSVLDCYNYNIFIRLMSITQKIPIVVKKENLLPIVGKKVIIKEKEKGINTYQTTTIIKKNHKIRYQERKKVKKQEKQKAVSKISIVNPSLSIVNLNVKGLNCPITRY